MGELKKGSLIGLALDRLKDLNENMAEGITREQVSRGQIKANTPLCDVSVAVTDSRRWIAALLEELK